MRATTLLRFVLPYRRLSVLRCRFEGADVIIEVSVRGNARCPGCDGQPSLPYFSSRLARLADPVPGDVVLCRLDNDLLTIKRVIAGPGADVTLCGQRVTVDGVMLEYLNVKPQDETQIRRGRLGPMIQIERGSGPDVYVSFDPANSRLDDEMEFTVPGNSYFVLGSNRDVAVDSRHFGSLSRDRILGRVVARL